MFSPEKKVILSSLLELPRIFQTDQHENPKIYKNGNQRLLIIDFSMNN